MTAKQISVLNAVPVHPGRGEPSYIALYVTLDYLKNTPIASEVLSENDALKLAEQLIHAVNIMRGNR
jgi:hypothetical protein